MCITELKSKSELSQFTESYWMLTADTWREYTLIPDGTFNVFVATCSFSIDNNEFNEGVYLSPILTRPNGIKGIVPNTIIPLTQPKSYYNEVLKTLKETCTIGDAIFELEQFNYEILHKEYVLNTNLREKVNFILDKRGNVSVQALSDEFAISRQALHKMFKSKLGISPKELCDSWRLNNYLNLIMSNDNLTSCALNAGFYDQAHSINTFKKYWQKNPSAYLNQDNSIITHISETINKRFTNYYDPEVLVLNKL